MQRKKRWRTALLYVLGSIFLALMIGAAVILPEAYSSWQDSRILSQVTTSARDSLEFIDADALNRAESLRLLSQVTQMGYGYMEYERDVLTGIDADTYNAALSSCKEEVELWIECGLLPDFIEEFFSSGNYSTNMTDEYLLTDQGVFHLYTIGFNFYTVMPYDEGNYDVCDSYLGLIVDSETGMIYLAILQDDEGRTAEYLVQELGYDSIEDFLENGAVRIPEVREAAGSRYDYATVSGASEAIIHAENGMLSLDAELVFDTFTAKAYRRVTDEGALFIFFGSLCWIGELSPESFMTAADLYAHFIGDEEGYLVSREEELDAFFYNCDDVYLQTMLAEMGYEEETEIWYADEHYDSSDTHTGASASGG